MNYWNCVYIKLVYLYIRLRHFDLRTYLNISSLMRYHYYNKINEMYILNRKCIVLYIA